MSHLIWIYVFPKLTFYFSGTLSYDCEILAIARELKRIPLNVFGEQNVWIIK